MEIQSQDWSDHDVVMPVTVNATTTRTGDLPNPDLSKQRSSSEAMQNQPAKYLDTEVPVGFTELLEERERLLQEIERSKNNSLNKDELLKLQGTLIETCKVLFSSAEEIFAHFKADKTRNISQIQELEVLINCHEEQLSTQKNKLEVSMWEVEELTGALHAKKRQTNDFNRKKIMAKREVSALRNLNKSHQENIEILEFELEETRSVLEKKTRQANAFHRQKIAAATKARAAEKQIADLKATNSSSQIHIRHLESQMAEMLEVITQKDYILAGPPPKKVPRTSSNLMAGLSANCYENLPNNTKKGHHRRYLQSPIDLDDHISKDANHGAHLQEQVPLYSTESQPADNHNLLDTDYFSDDASEQEYFETGGYPRSQVDHIFTSAAPMYESFYDPFDYLNPVALPSMQTSPRSYFSNSSIIDSPSDTYTLISEPEPAILSNITAPPSPISMAPHRGAGNPKHVLTAVKAWEWGSELGFLEWDEKTHTLSVDPAVGRYIEGHRNVEFGAKELREDPRFVEY
ncbi:hypothetical protein BS50DRAFT_584488 [Corynespora cassiicola Philippines]|uniref:Uncharacterized protein n=1 Tax=Corynespora cassiicola Philippines TaxID=1448308 RepID=A0A2T2NZR6_CORCC|nr:hypothetical protein BS50DRAFT_584488 [Corynespora cassiicola Philippines]